MTEMTFLIRDEWMTFIHSLALPMEMNSQELHFLFDSFGSHINRHFCKNMFSQVKDIWIEVLVRFMLRHCFSSWSTLASGIQLYSISISSSKIKSWWFCLVNWQQGHERVARQNSGNSFLFISSLSSSSLLPASSTPFLLCFLRWRSRCPSTISICGH